MRSSPVAFPLAILAMSIAAACTSPAAKSEPPHASGGASANAGAQGERKYELGRADGTAIVQLYADGFEQLSLHDKILCWHLTQAAIAGRDIAIDQRFAYNLPIRYVLESLWLVKETLPADVRAEVERYTQLFWIHNGIHNNLSTKKELLRLSKAQFDDALRQAEPLLSHLPVLSLGLDRPLQFEHDLSGRITNIRRGQRELLAPAKNLDDIFDICTDPRTFVSCTDKSPANDGDPVAASCNNLYVGCTSKDLEHFDEHYGLASRVVKNAAGKLEEQVYRCGDGKQIPPGLYAEQLSAVNRHLREALPFAPEATRKALEQLIRYNETGDPQDWRNFNIAWVQDKDSVVDFALGFIEVYLDVRGIKGAWQAVISFRNEAKTKEIAALAQETQWFEDRMPWEERFKKKQVKGISARAIAVITETGDCGPITPVGVNLPNEADIRQQYGSKSVNLSNVVEAYDKTQGKGAAHEFASSPEEAARADRYASAMDDLHTNLHEVVGHASGQVLGNEEPSKALGAYYSTLEEARADLVGLYWIADSKLKAMGLVPDDDAVLAKYEAYSRNALLQLRRVPEGGKIEEDHMRNRQMIVHWLLHHQAGVAMEKRAGKTFYRVTSIGEYRDGCGRLLAEVMRIKATGDFAAGKQLVEVYGTQVDPALRAEVLQRIQALHLPSVTGFVQPELHAVTDASGRITDVQVSYPCDLAAQMLRWSGRRR